MGQGFAGGPAPTGQDIVTEQSFGVAGDPGRDAESTPPAPSDDGMTATAVRAVLGGGLGGLVSGVVRDLQGILRGEIQLAKTELKEEATVAAGGAASIAAGGVVALAGGAFLLNAVVELLGRIMPRWLASALVGLGLLGAAGSLGVTGKEKLSATTLTPTRTAQSLRETAVWAKEKFGSATGRQGAVQS
jgi:hypothetical protein